MRTSMKLFGLKNIYLSSVFYYTVLVISLLQFGYSSAVRLRRELIGNNVVSLKTI